MPVKTLYSSTREYQPRPQDLLLVDFQNAGWSGEDFSQRCAILKIVEDKALGTRLP